MSHVEWVHRHHNPDDLALPPDMQLEWMWHAHPHEPTHVDTNGLEPLDGSGHPLDVTVPLDDAMVAEMNRQMAAFKRANRPKEVLA